MPTISSRFRRFFSKDGKHREQSSARVQADDRSLAAGSSQANDRGAAAGSSHAGESSQPREQGDGNRDEVRDTNKTPWPAVCLLKSYFGEDEQQGTGFLFSDTTVITAAHNLWKNVNGSVVQPHTIEIRLTNSDELIPFVLKTPNVKNTLPYYQPKYDPDYEALLKKQAKTKRKSEEWKEFEKLMSYIDYGAILLSIRINPAPEFFFKISGTTPQDPRWNKRLVSTGYSPLDGNPNFYKLYYAKGAAYTGADRFIGPNQDLVRHNASVEPGQSGGPLFLLDGDVVVGIQVKYNSSIGHDPTTFGAVRITSKMENLFKTWDAEHRDSLGPSGSVVA